MTPYFNIFSFNFFQTGQIGQGEPPENGEMTLHALQTQDSKFKPRRSEDEHACSRSRRLPPILSFTSGLG